VHICITLFEHRDLHTRISAQKANNLKCVANYPDKGLNPYFVTGFIDAIGEECFSILFIRSKNSKLG
jgi:hypothetical protein